MQRLGLIFAGSGAFGVPSLSALAERHDVRLVVSQPDRPAGRGHTVTPTPATALGSRIGLPILRTDNINAESLPDCDAMIVIAFGQKISESVVHRPRLGSVNLHASIL